MTPQCALSKGSGVLAPLVVGLALLTALTSGCGVGGLVKGELRPPKVTLKAVGFQAPTQQGWPLTCVLGVTNPNPLTLNLLGYDYEVRVEGRSVAQGESSQAVSLPAQGEVQVEAPVLLKLKALTSLVPRLLKDGKIPYEITGGLRLPQTLGFRVPFRFTGELTAEKGWERLHPLLDKLR